MNNILTNRTIHICEDNNGGRVWADSPAKFLYNNFRSVIRAEYYNQVSSSGDWSGYFVQKIGRNNYYVSFSQVNNAFVGYGYTLYTGSVFMSGQTL